MIDSEELNDFHLVDPHFETRNMGDKMIITDTEEQPKKSFHKPKYKEMYENMKGRSRFWMGVAAIGWLLFLISIIR